MRRTVRDHLLEGEDPTTIHPRDARHWIGVYREMIQFKRELLARVGQEIALLSPEAQDELKVDIDLIQDQLARYERRLNFWFQRQWDLEGLVVDDSTRTISYRDRAISLTRREYQILTTLMTKPDRFFSGPQLLAEAWHDTRLPYEQLRTYVGRLRRKLDALGSGAAIRNRARVGYALVFRDPAEA